MYKLAGFTLVELLMAVAIGALLAAIAMPVYTDYVRRSETGQAMADLGRLDLQIERFAANNFRPPASLAELGVAPPLDPWGRPYRYLRIEGAGPAVLAQVRKDRNLVPINGDYDLYSLGPDGASRPPLVDPVSQDDIVRAGNGAFIGAAADF